MKYFYILNKFREYKNLRFFFTIFSVYAIVQLPYLWLKICGNLNGMSIPVMATGYAPWVAGIAMVCHWAIQGLPADMAAKLLPWQHIVLAQFAWGVCILAIILVPLGCPNLTYLVREQRHREIPKGVDGVSTFFNLIKSNWREHFALQVKTTNLQLNVHILLMLNSKILSFKSFFVCLCKKKIFTSSVES